MKVFLIIFFVTYASFADEILPGTIAKTIGALEVCRVFSKPSSKPQSPCALRRPNRNKAYQTPNVLINTGEQILIQEVKEGQATIEVHQNGEKIQAYVNTDKLLRTAQVGLVLPKTLLDIQREKTHPSVFSEICPLCDSLKEIKNNFSCPEEFIHQTENSKEWTFQQSKKLILGCAVQKLKLVKRVNKENLSLHCMPYDKTDYSDKEEWIACPPPPLCSSAQIEIEKKKAHNQLNKDKMACNPKVILPLEKIEFKEKPQFKSEQCVLALEDPHKIVIHHTAASPYMDASDIQVAHLKSGWSDIGYHFIIAKTPNGGWKVFEARPLTHQGAHVGAGLNADSIGISIAGNYLPRSADSLNPEQTDMLPPPEAIEQLIALVADLKKKYPKINEVQSHTHAKIDGSGCPTECPGPGCEQLVPSLNLRLMQGSQK